MQCASTVLNHHLVHCPGASAAARCRSTTAVCLFFAQQPVGHALQITVTADVLEGTIGPRLSWTLCPRSRELCTSWALCTPKTHVAQVVAKAAREQEGDVTRLKGHVQDRHFIHEAFECLWNVVRVEGSVLLAGKGILVLMSVVFPRVLPDITAIVGRFIATTLPGFLIVLLPGAYGRLRVPRGPDPEKVRRYARIRS